jgi:hypothetical protein
MKLKPKKSLGSYEFPFAGTSLPTRNVKKGSSPTQKVYTPPMPVGKGIITRATNTTTRFLSSVFEASKDRGLGFLAANSKKAKDIIPENEIFDAKFLKKYHKIARDQRESNRFLKENVYVDFLTFEGVQVLLEYLQKVITLMRMDLNLLRKNQEYTDQISDLYSESGQRPANNFYSRNYSETNIKETNRQIKTVSNLLDARSSGPWIREAGGVLVISKKTLLEMGISLCNLSQAQAQFWVLNVIKHLRDQPEDLSETEDFKLYGLYPGQQLKYYGAFGSRYSTHHFIYIYNGVISEVGADIIPDCKPLGPEDLSEFATGRAGYKTKMNYYGLSHLGNVVYWLQEQYKDTSEEKVYLVSFGNDNIKKDIIKKLYRVVSIIGPWQYALIASNNCENASNFVSTGVSLSVQSCMLSGQNKITADARAVVLGQEVPTCKSGLLIPRVLSKNNCACIGDYFQDGKKFSCKTKANDCGGQDKDEVLNTDLQSVCYSKQKGRRIYTSYGKYDPSIQIQTRLRTRLEAMRTSATSRSTQKESPKSRLSPLKESPVSTRLRSSRPRSSRPRSSKF